MSEITFRRNPNAALYRVLVEREPFGDHEPKTANEADLRAAGYVPARELESRRWIPVTERLPEHREQVMFAAGDGEVVCLGFYPGNGASEWVDLERDHNGFNFIHPAEEVTHWREIPDPPLPSAPEQTKEEANG